MNRKRKFDSDELVIDATKRKCSEYRFEFTANNPMKPIPSVILSDLWLHHIIPFLTRQEISMLRLTCRGFLKIASSHWEFNISRSHFVEFWEFLQINPNWPTKIHTFKLMNHSELNDFYLANTPFDFSLFSESNAFSSLKRIDVAFVQQHIDEEKIKLLPPTITEIDFSSCWKIYNLSYFQLPVSITSITLKHCEMLRQFDFSKLTKLCHLNLDYCKRIDSNSLETLPDSITKLGLSNCNQLLSISRFPKSLTKLDLSECLKIGWSTIYNIPTSLKKLNIMGCKQLTDAPFPHAFPALKSLDITFCNQLSKMFMKTIPQKLERLYAAGCQGFNPAIFEFLPQTLEDLDLSHSFPISGNTFKMLPSKLQTLKIRDCNDWNSQFTKDLPRSLTSLDLCDCSIRDDSIPFLPQSLTEMCALACPALTIEGFKDYCKTHSKDFPELSFLRVSPFITVTRRQINQWRH